MKKNFMRYTSAIVGICVGICAVCPVYGLEDEEETTNVKTNKKSKTEKSSSHSSSGNAISRYSTELFSVGIAAILALAGKCVYDDMEYKKLQSELEQAKSQTPEESVMRQIHEIETLRNQLEQLQQEKSRLEENIVSLNSRINTNTENNTNLNNRCYEQETRISSLNNDLATRNIQIQRLHDELRQKQTGIDELNNQIAEQRRLIIRLYNNSNLNQDEQISESISQLIGGEIPLDECGPMSSDEFIASNLTSYLHVSVYRDYDARRFSKYGNWLGYWYDFKTLLRDTICEQRINRLLGKYNLSENNLIDILLPTIQSTYPTLGLEYCNIRKWLQDNKVLDFIMYGT